MKFRTIVHVTHEHTPFTQPPVTKVVYEGEDRNTAWGMAVEFLGSVQTLTDTDGWTYERIMD